MTPHPVFGAPSDDLPLVERPGSYAIALDGAGRIATVRVPSGPHLPGGGREDGESPEDALRREVREEIAYSLVVLSRVGRADLHAPCPGEGACFLKQGTFFEIRLGAHDPDLLPEHDLDWLPVAAFLAACPDPSHVWAVERLLARS